MKDLRIYQFYSTLIYQLKFIMSFNFTILNNRISTSTILEMYEYGIEGNNYNGLQIFSVCFAIIISLFLLGVFIFIIKLFIIDEFCCRRKSNKNYIVDNINQQKNETQDNIYEYL